MLEVSHLSKRYGKLLANDDVTFSVGDGQIAVLVGPNGAGKSTLLKSVAGLLRFQGQVLIQGHPNRSLEAKAALGYIPELPAVYDLLTVWEHLELVARCYSLASGWEQRGRELLERFELDGKRDTLGKELSKGMQQKVSLLAAILHQPRVYIFDEPLVGLDPHAIKELKLLFHQLREQGATLLISTHMLDSVEDFWDAAYIMMNGRLAAQMRAGEAREDGKSLEEVFFDITEGGNGQ